MRAQELANDLAHQLELTEAERDEAVRERDEAQAVVDAVRKVRDVTRERAAQLSGRWVTQGRAEDRSAGDTAWAVVALLDGIDGL